MRQWLTYRARMDRSLPTPGYVEGRDWLARRCQVAGHHHAAWTARVEVPLTFLLAPEREVPLNVPASPSPSP